MVEGGGGGECHRIPFFSLAVWVCGVALGDLREVGGGDATLIKETFS